MEHMDLNPLLGVLFRWLHITSVVILIGGIFYARFLAGELSPRFRGWTYGAVAALIGSGLYNLLTKASYPAGYHMWFGIKMLLVLHVIVVALLMTTPAVDHSKRLRLMSGVALSGLTVILISAWLRWMSQA